MLMALFGAVTPVVLMNGYKVIGQWFPSHQLGLANGVIAMGMALGYLIGSFFSATTFSPWLGGWRNVLIAYGATGALFSIPWFFTRTISADLHPAGTNPSIWKPLKHVVGLKNIWLLGFALFGISGAIQGALGYLPLYLRGLGWQPLSADGALSAFHTVSLIFVLPFSLWSDRLGSRKRLLLIANLLIAVGLGLLSFAGGGMIWVAVVCAGLMRDTFMAIFTTMVIETRKVGAAYAGTATGFTMALGSLNNFVAPPIGNSLASLWPGAPFAFWSALCVLGIICIVFVEAGIRRNNNAVGEFIATQAE
ncbi:MFS transporter [bacterium]|nr:MAG: MFS transporter [bacterium]